MFDLEKEKLQKVVSLVDNLEVHPDVTVDYFIPGVLVTTDDSSEPGGPHIKFTYRVNGVDPHIQEVPLIHSYLEKTAEDLANLITSSLERFIEEIDSRQYGAQ